MVPTIKRPNTTLFVLLFFPFLEPVGLDTLPVLPLVLNVWKIASLAYLAFVFLPQTFVARPKRPPVGYWGLALFWIVFLVSCLRSGAGLVQILVSAISSLLLLRLIRFEIDLGNGRILLKSLSALFTVCILAHIASVMLYAMGLNPRGISGGSVYLFGMDNYSSFFIYPMLCIVLFYHALTHGRLTVCSWFLLLVTVGTYLLTFSVTAAGAGLLLIGLCLMHRSWHKLPKLAGIRWAIVGTSVLLILICGLQIQNLLANLLNSMDKGVTLNSRTYIWDKTLQLIVQHPVIGNGVLTDQQIKSYILYGASHAHNLLLELLLRTGIAGTLGYLLFLCGFLPIGALSGSKKHPKNLLLIGLICQLILSFMDFYPSIMLLYIYMGIVYGADKLICQFAPEERESQ